MKKILALCFLSCLLFNARATTIFYPVELMTGSAEDVTLNVRAVNNPILWAGKFHYLPERGTNVTTVNGYGTNQLVPGKYTVAIPGLTKSWTMNVTNSATAVSAVDLSTGLTIYSGIQTLQVVGGYVTNDGLGNFTVINTNSSGVSTQTVQSIVQDMRAITNAQTGIVTISGVVLGSGGGSFTGPVYLPSGGGSDGFLGNGSVQLANGNFQIDTSGNVTAPSYNGTGALLTGLDPANLNSGTAGINITGTAANLPAGTVVNQVDLGAGTNVNITPQLNSRTNSAVLNSVVVTNSNGSLSVNGGDTSVPGFDPYGNILRMFPGSGDAYQWLHPNSAQRSDVWGNNGYYKMVSGDANFPGLRLNSFGFGNPNNHVEEGGVAVNTEGRIGGSGGALYDLPIQPEQNAEMLPYPPTFITSWNLRDMVLHQTNLWAQLTDSSTNGLLYAFTNQGLPLWYHMDSNVRWLTNYRVAGNLGIDLAAFPAGTNFLRQFQTNGWKFSLTMYANKMPTNGTVYVNLTGTEVVAGTADSSPAMTPNSAASDVAKFYGWGIDMFRGSDTIGDNGFQRAWPRVLANLILNPIGPSGLRYYWKDSYQQDGANFRPLALLWLTPRLGEKDGEAYSQANVVNHDARNNGYGAWLGDNSAGTEVEIGALNLARSAQTNEVPHLKPGHWITGQTIFTNTSTQMRARWLLTPPLLQCGALNLTEGTNGGIFNYMPTVATEIMNAGWISIRKDFVAGQLPFFAQDNGATNTSVLARKLFNGDYAVGIFNEAASQQTVNLTWRQLGVPDAQYLFASDVWNATNMTAYDRTMTVTLAAKEMRLLRLSPCRVQYFETGSTSLYNFGRITPTTEAPTGTYWPDGVSVGGAGVGRLTIFPAWSATNVILETQVGASAAMAWTNTIDVSYFVPGVGRVITASYAADHIYIGAANATSNYITTVNFPLTNCVKAIKFSFEASTNSGTRYLSPSIKAIIR